MSWKQFLAWCVHLYTGMGLVAAGGMAVAIIVATPESFRFTFVLMMVATLIDATDGTLARAVHIKEVLPGFDGRRLDDLIDFQTFTSLPLLLIRQAGLIEPYHEAWLLLPLLASAYGFCQVAAKTDDGYFLGFPSYWNIIAFYLYLLRPAPLVAVGMLVFFALMTFVPARYLYPTHRGRLNKWTNILGAVWAAVLVVILARMPANEEPLDLTTWRLVLASLLFPVYYLVASWLITLRIALRAARMKALDGPHDSEGPSR